MDRQWRGATAVAAFLSIATILFLIGAVASKCGGFQ